MSLAVVAPGLQFLCPPYGHMICFIYALFNIQATITFFQVLQVYVI